MRKSHYRYQRTIARPARIEGQGFGTGQAIRMRFLPAPHDTGVVFRRLDLPSAPPIRAGIAAVTETHRRTVLGSGPGRLGMVEHVLAALAGLRIDNCLIEIDAPELPGLDGSAQPFIQVLAQAGAVLQPARRTAWSVAEPIGISQNGATLTLHPRAGNQLKISYVLDYGYPSPLGRQTHSEIISPENFTNHLAACRTFILEEELLALRSQGILRVAAPPPDLVIFGPKGPISHQLRYANEPARHKILDMLGDLSLLGQDLSGHLVAYRSGHRLNVEFVRLLAQQLSGKRAPQLRAA